MALEAQDIGDSTILDQTKQYENGNGQIQFKITLPSGRELESEWLKPDMKKKAMVAWLDVVKAEAVADSDAARAEAREAAMKQQRAQRDAPQAPVQTQEVASTLLASLGAQPVPRQATAAGSAASVSPDSFVEQGLQAADNEVEYWTQQAAEATTRLLAAQQSRIKWAQIKAAMGGQGANAGNGSQYSDSQGNSRRAAGRIGGTRKRKPSKPPAESFPDSAISDVRPSDPGV